MTRNMAHSCGRYEIADHFAAKEPIVRELFDDLSAVVAGFGPVTVYAEKTRIVFQVRVRFLSAVPRRRWLDCTLWLKRRAVHPLIRHVERLPPHDYIHHFRVQSARELDPELVSLLREAYGVGGQDGRARRSKGESGMAPPKE